MCRPILARLFAASLSLAASCCCTAEEIDYLRHIKPLLSEKCYACHGALKQESELRLETRELMLQGGDSGQVIVPGDPDASLILERITADEYEQMPPADEGAALLPEQVALLRQWILQGAVAPKEAPPPAPRDHWAFQGVRRPSIPSGAERSANPIDALLQEKRHAAGVSTQPLAPRSLRLRRLYLDLIGLPPSREQLLDRRPWRQIVDELLANPHHGERWARHWMDIWRYCDWYGLGAQLRYSQKHLWHWRDWIVDSLNQDKGYDQMILEMLAGDELAPEDPQVVAATGYLARNYYLFNRTTWLDTTIEHTSKAFLGLTLNCAKCHDHKYDPITHEDYYRFRAIFEPHQVRLDPIAGVTDFEQDGLPRVFDDHIDLETYLHVRGDPKNPDRSRNITPGVPEVLSSFAEEVRPVSLPVTAYAPGTRPYVQRDRLAAARHQLEKAEQELSRAREEVDRVAMATATAASSVTAGSPAAATLAAATPAEEAADFGQGFEFVEDFEQLDLDRWQIDGDGWRVSDGKLQQTVSTRKREQVRLLKRLPRNFELDCHYTTTGGDTYKSVTFRFDQSPQGDYCNYVYTSAHSPGPKVQVAFERDGKSTYPPQGRKSHPIKVGQSYHLRFAVRDEQVNVWINGEFMVAYRYPDRRDGFLSLAAFDATVDIESIELRSLQKSTALQDPGADPQGEPLSLAEALELAQLKRDAAWANLRSVEATIRADNAKFNPTSSQQTQAELAAMAARRQAEAEIARSEVDARSSDKKKISAAKKVRQAAQTRLTAISKGEIEYESIRGAKKALESPAHTEDQYPTSYAPTSTGRRLALARWIANRENPLTARVAVNQVWLRHFGSPLVESVFDFGLRAKKPLHHELLDLLADEFMASGWSFHHLHRLIVTSQAYQLSSSSRAADESTLAADPTNRFYWRANSRRMESQVVRDSLLLLARKLDTQLGGPSVPPGPAIRRRSLYFQHSPDQLDRFIETFDNADVLQCYRRTESIVPQQSLALANSRLSIEMSGAIESSVQAELEEKTRVTFIEAVFFLLLGREATETERDACQDFLDDMIDLASNGDKQTAERRARVRLVHSILNHNDFITIR